MRTKSILGEAWRGLFGRGDYVPEPARPPRAALALLAAGFLFVAACGGNHRDQPYYEAQEQSEFFGDGKSARPLVPNTVPQGQARLDEHLYAGTSAGKPVNEFPFPVTERVMQRGMQQYNAHCVPCHGFAGNGDGMIVRRGYTRPTSYHDERLRNEPLSHYYDVIANGYGAMPSYADQVYPRDRWAIIAYIRALQLSQNADVRQLPQEDRQRLDNPQQPAPEGGEAEGEGAEGHGE